MANVNIGQVRSILHSVPAGQHVRIQAGVLKSILDQAKALNGNNDLVVAQVTTTSNAPDINLTTA